MEGQRRMARMNECLFLIVFGYLVNNSCLLFPVIPGIRGNRSGYFLQGRFLQPDLPQQPFQFLFDVLDL
ncbi:MAG: hypothetical protein AVO38_13965 [delta proteobacterium ML8_D]|nr:MAG: hypothetical protein AVO38_13965 [delta proteobacterium ML8_D]